MKNIILIISSLFLFSPSLFAEAVNQVSVGQGIALPGQNNFLNWGNGYTAQNPVGASYADGLQLTGQYESGDNADGMGAELVYGGNDWGVGIGYRDPNDDSNDDEITSAALGLQWANFLGIGLRWEEDHHSAGLLFFPDGSIRIGVMFDALNDDDDTLLVDEENQNLGLGLAYVGQSFFATLDASKREYSDDTLSDSLGDIIAVSAGLGVVVNNFTLSVTHDTFLEDDNDVFEDDTWIGMGYKASNWKLELYSEFVKDWSVAFTYMF